MTASNFTDKQTINLINVEVFYDAKKIVEYKLTLIFVH